MEVFPGSLAFRSGGTGVDSWHQEPREGREGEDKFAPQQAKRHNQTHMEGCEDTLRPTADGTKLEYKWQHVRSPSTLWIVNDVRQSRQRLRRGIPLTPGTKIEKPKTLLIFQVAAPSASFEQLVVDDHDDRANGNPNQSRVLAGRSVQKSICFYQLRPAHLRT